MIDIFMEVMVGITSRAESAYYFLDDFGVVCLGLWTTIWWNAVKYILTSAYQ